MQAVNCASTKKGHSCLCLLACCKSFLRQEEAREGPLFALEEHVGVESSAAVCGKVTQWPRAAVSYRRDRRTRPCYELVLQRSTHGASDTPHLPFHSLRTSSTKHPLCDCCIRVGLWDSSTAAVWLSVSETADPINSMGMFQVDPPLSGDVLGEVEVG
jgi:hypothetical protein